MSTSNVLLGEITGKDEKFLLTPLSIEEEEVKLTKGKENIDAEITAFVGNKTLKSEAKHTITLHYGLNSSRQWEVQGVNVNNPVIRVIPRTQ